MKRDASSTGDQPDPATLQEELEALRRENQQLWEEVRQRREREHLFDTLLDNLPDHIYFKDRESRFLLASLRYRHLTQQFLLAWDYLDPQR